MAYGDKLPLNCCLTIAREHLLLCHRYHWATTPGLSSPSLCGCSSSIMATAHLLLLCHQPPLCQPSHLLWWLLLRQPPPVAPVPPVDYVASGSAANSTVIGKCNRGCRSGCRGCRLRRGG
ncbi:hypothetical protein BS78_03G165500 [Paspalum vaginatum]|nr:hypothetical protein BS78_03G165500 [Paspalum vaginatum]